MKIYVSTVVENEGKFILVREKKEQCYGKWNIPSGHVEEDEFIIDAAIREVKEETNIDVELTGVIAVFNNMFENFNSISFVFSSNITKNNEINFNKNEIIEIKWFTFEEIKSMKEELRDYNYILESITRYNEDNIIPLDTIIIR